MFYIVIGILFIGVAIYLLVDESGGRAVTPKRNHTDYDPLGILEKWKNRQ